MNMRAIKQTITGFSIGIIFIAIYLSLSVVTAPRAETILIAANVGTNINPVKKAISKIYIKMTVNKACSLELYYSRKRLIIEDARFLFATLQAAQSVTNEELDRKIILKELHEASKYCGSSVFHGKIGGEIFKYPPPVYIILSKDVDYFETIAKNCVPFDTEYNMPNGSTRTPRGMLENLISRSEGKDHAIYTEMMDFLRKNEARCSGK